MKHAPIAIYEIDFDGSKFRSVNSAVSQMLGYSEEELFAMNPSDLLVGESKRKFQIIIGEALLGKKTLFSAELEVRAKNGQILWGLFHARLNLKDGIPETVQVFAQDITDLKKSEEECKVAQERFKSLVESTSDWIWEINQNGIYIYASPKIKDILGYEPSEVLGKTPFHLMPKQETEKIAIKFQEFAKQKTPFHSLENWNVHKNGTLVLLETSGVPILDDKGRLLGYRGIDRDITERKKTEEALRTSEERLQNIISAMDEGIVLIGLDGRVIDCNEAALKQLNIKREELIGKVIMDFMFSENKENFVKEIQDILRKTGKAIVETQALRKNDSPLSVDISLTRFYDKDKKPVGLLGVARDITERKKAEEALRESEERFSKAFHANPTAMAISCLDGQLVDVNIGFERLLGYSRQEVLEERVIEKQGRKLSLYALASERQKLIQQLKEKGGVSDYEIVFRHKTGKPVTVILSLEQIFLKEQPHFLGTAIDITERKKMEEKLAESEILYRTLFDNSEDGFILIEPLYDENGKVCDFRFLKVNRAYERQTGRKAAVVEGNRAKEVAPELEQEWVSLVGKVANTGKSARYENFNRQTSRWYDAYYFPFAKDKVGILFRDITERKKAEEALKESESKFQNLFEQSPTVYEIYNKDGLLIKANSAWEKLWGFPRTVSVGKWNILESEQIAKTGIQPFVKRAYLGETVIVPEKEFDSSLEARSHREGSKRLLNSIIYPIRNESGEVTNLVIMHEDVTVEKILRKQLEEKERLATIGQTAGMIGHDIRNPLQAIIGELYLAKEVMSQAPEGKDKQEALESLNFVQSQVDYINKIVSDLQDYARPLNPEYVIADLSDLIANVFETVSLPDNIKLEIDVKGTLKLKTDTTFIKRAMTNLVNNAIQAMPDGGELKVTVHEKEDSQVVSVSDTGKGIPENVKADLFKPLVTTKAKGQGLGLAVVKRLVEALNGKVTVESDLGKGTKFTITLPTK